MNENYMTYLSAYTAHHNRRVRTYGGNIITEKGAESHSTVKEVKNYYEAMAGIDSTGD
ncbi:hypothetical protein MCG98_18600 [Ruminococcus sp. OA3]|uniref:hypothetical protein n=1 Tax=Ruminococcus sp. OA3 TaxID=2914164 RepID=UPI001F068786|nr:hypothetical protein [Ruminococcus sp. OA3]MCH1984568.1 hypothetical protein [Ruminococcus sp. OA3]